MQKNIKNVNFIVDFFEKDAIMYIEFFICSINNIFNAIIILKSKEACVDYLKRALELNEETLANRRHIHQNAEAGLCLPNTKEFVRKKLSSYGIEASDCGEGLVATIGNKGKVILLRADMDALPMDEESGEEFSSKTSCAHTCGHDLHTAMLLTASKLLKENEANLNGTVKLMFQPGEEIFEGGKNMLENGILENPKVDVAMGFHVAAGQFPVDMIMYNKDSTMMASVDVFKILVHGKGAHGAYPHLGIDPINIAVNIFNALQELIAKETDPTHSCILTIGKIQAGTAPNIIPETALLEGTIRTNNADAREKLVRRLKEVSEGMAKVFDGSAEVEMVAGVAPLVCDKALTEEMVSYIRGIGIENLAEYPGVTSSASEDFASVAERVPSTFIYVSAGFLDDRGKYAVHNPKVRFNEEVCPRGAAYFAHCATKWLENHTEQ